MSNTDRDSMLERWADGMETLAQYYEDKYGPPATPATLPSVTDINGMIEAIADELEKAQININKDSSVYHNKDAAYVKTVPAHTISTNIEKIGGKTIIWNQLSGSITDRGETWIRNDVVWTRTAKGGTFIGTASADFSNMWLMQFPMVLNHKFLVVGTPVSDGAELKVTTGGAYVAKTENFIFKASSSSTCSIGFSAPSTTEIDFNWEPQIFDLTLMYGTGNEPSTYAEFQTMFPNNYYDADSGTLFSAGVTSVVSKDSDDTTIDTYSVPADLQALTGYGWSCPNHYNYVDFDSKKFVQEVGSRAYDAGDESDADVITDGTNTYYALTTPVETDISTYIDSDAINTVPGGTLTFENVNGDGYRIPVPSTEMFWVGVS